MKFSKLKNLGLHRGNPRLYFQSPDLASIGFAPGTRYDLDLYSAGPGIELFSLVVKVNPEGRRKVCKKVVGTKTFSIIDINTALHLDWLRDQVQVEIDYSMHKITICAVTDQRAAFLISKGLA